MVPYNLNNYALIFSPQCAKLEVEKRQRASILCILLSSLFFRGKYTKVSSAPQRAVGDPKRGKEEGENGKGTERGPLQDCNTIRRAGPSTWILEFKEYEHAVSRALSPRPSPRRSRHHAETPFPLRFLTHGARKLSVRRDGRKDGVFLMIVQPRFSRRENPRGIPHVRSRRRGKTAESNAQFATYGTR